MYIRVIFSYFFCLCCVLLQKKRKNVHTGDFQFLCGGKIKKDPIGVQLEDVLGKKNSKKIRGTEQNVELMSTE